MTVQRMSNEAAEADEEGWKKLQKIAPKRNRPKCHCSRDRFPAAVR